MRARWHAPSARSTRTRCAATGIWLGLGGGCGGVRADVIGGGGGGGRGRRADKACTHLVSRGGVGRALPPERPTCLIRSLPPQPNQAFNL
jgi:hypothetical protein